MALVSQEIDDLLGGVSQQDVRQRDANQVEEEVNGLLNIATGNSKRPPSQHSAVLSAAPTAAYDSVHTHVVSRSSTDRYRVILSDGDLKVFDAVDGLEETVVFPDGKTYLDTADPARDFRCVTIGDNTYITNGSVTVLRGTAVSPAVVNDALVYVKQADYSTTFSVTIEGVTVTYTTPDGSTPASQRDELGTERIATELKTLIDAHASLSGFNDCLQYGSTLYIKRANGADFTIAATDGLADEAIIAIKGTIQSFEMLPERARHGFVVEVVGDPANASDNYFVKYDSNSTANKAGFWKETVKPGIPTDLNSATLPHQLRRGEVQYQGVVVASIPGPPSVLDFSGTVKHVRWEADAIYPAGLSTVLTLGAEAPLEYSSTVDKTGAQIATAFTALINAQGIYAATNTVEGLIEITISLAVFVYMGDWMSGPMAYVPELALTVNAHIGKVINNISDGSSGTVTANTLTTLTVASLTGGGTNTFRKGDLIDIVGTTTDFYFTNALWKPRKVGTLQTAPYPSFVSKKIGELFSVKGRLGFLSEGRLVTSRTGDYLNLFRETVTQLLPTDPIDVISATQKVGNFHSATHWDEGVLLWSSQGQYSLEGDPLTPETVGLTLKTEFTNSTRLRPVVAGRRIFFTRGKGTTTQVMTYALTNDGDRKADADDITRHIPTYIAGTPIQMVAEFGFLALLTDADQSKLYVCSYHYESQTLVQRAWSRWEFAAGTRIVSLDIIDSKLGLVVSRPGGVYLEVIDLDPSAV